MMDAAAGWKMMRGLDWDVSGDDGEAVRVGNDRHRMDGERTDESTSWSG
jgi:hypothetical protein